MTKPKPLAPIAVLREYLRICDESPSGLVWIKKPARNVRAGANAGAPISLGYFLVCLRGHRMRAHRIVWALHHGRDPGPHQIDHADGNSGNNRPANLRLATHAQNTWNMRGARSRLGNPRGVQRRGNRFRAYISVDGRATHIGTYATPEEASAAHEAAALRLRGEFAHVHREAGA